MNDCALKCWRVFLENYGPPSSVWTVEFSPRLPVKTLLFAQVLLLYWLPLLQEAVSPTAIVWLQSGHLHLPFLQDLYSCWELLGPGQPRCTPFMNPWVGEHMCVYYTHTHTYSAHWLSLKKLKIIVFRGRRKLKDPSSQANWVVLQTRNQDLGKERDFASSHKVNSLHCALAASWSLVLGWPKNFVQAFL